mgnify:CR=1 FL=1
MDAESRYIVGIDLGTTNTALAYVDTQVPVAARVPCVFAIPQLTAPGEVSELPVLPSAVYLPGPRDVVPETLRLPWHEAAPDSAVGAWARDLAAQQPARVVASAKSWLCCEAINRRSACLPFSRGDQIGRAHV